MERTGLQVLAKSFLIFLLFLSLYGIEIAHAQLFSPQSYVEIKPGTSREVLLEQAVKITPSPRQLRWQQLELTAFIHFGINTFTNKEWGEGTESPAIFNPLALDARQWVRVCKENGFKQVILTAKHHDGFCLWPSKFTEHSVKNSPWKNGSGDVVKEVAAACKEYGVGFGIYLSPWDRNSKYFGSAAYNDYFINQLTELLTDYGRIDEVWFDGANGEGPNGKKQIYEYDRWYTLIRKLQPHAVIAVSGPDVRWVGTESGYGRETEWSVVPGDELLQDKIAANSQKEVAFAPVNMMEKDLGSVAKLEKAKSLVWYPAEIDVSIRPGWFHHPEENNKVKTPAALMDIYYNSVGRNGVLLLNIPPNKEGVINQEDVKALEGFNNLKKETFAKNLLKNATTKYPPKAFRNLLDGLDNTSWAPAKGVAQELIFSFKQPIEFNVLSLQENIRLGQRVEAFKLEYKEGTAWKTIINGTTIGYKRLLHFKTVKAIEVRLKIINARASPVIAEIGLFKGKIN